MTLFQLMTETGWVFVGHNCVLLPMQRCSMLSAFCPAGQVRLNAVTNDLDQLCQNSFDKILLGHTLCAFLVFVVHPSCGNHFDSRRRQVVG